MSQLEEYRSNMHDIQSMMFRIENLINRTNFYFRKDREEKASGMYCAMKELGLQVFMRDGIVCCKHQDIKEYAEKVAKH